MMRARIALFEDMTPVRSPHILVWSDIVIFYLAFEKKNCFTFYLLTYLFVFFFYR